MADKFFQFKFKGGPPRFEAMLLVSKEFTKSITSGIREVLKPHVRTGRARIKMRSLKSLLGFRLRVIKRAVIEINFGFKNRGANYNEALAMQVQEYGSKGQLTRKATRGNYFWVPTELNRDALGAAMIKPRDIGDLGFVQKTKAGNLVAFRRILGGEIQPLFVLRKTIAPVPAQPVVSPLKQSLPAEIEAVVREKMEEALKGARREI